jgi:hypothetical protein
MTFHGAFGDALSQAKLTGLRRKNWRVAALIVVVVLVFMVHLCLFAGRTHFLNDMQQWHFSVDKQFVQFDHAPLTF